jgi:putative ABC transport system permease protein
MGPLKRLLARVAAFFGGRSLDRDFDQELESHVAMQTDENIRRGMSPGEARRAAMVRLGGVTSLAQQHREARGLPALEHIMQDVRFAFRLMAKDRWFSAAAILVMALGIGANTTGFTIVNAAFLRGLPFADADRLFMVTWINDRGRRDDTAPLELQDWRDRSRTFAELAGYRDGRMNISDDRAFPDEVRGTWMTANAFSVIRQQPLLGRDFAAGEDRPGAEPVLIISDNLWKNRYAADAGVLGQVLRVNGQAATIVGVMPDGVKFPSNTDVWAPFVATPELAAAEPRPLTVFGRLADGARFREAQAEMSAIATQQLAANPQATKELVGIRVETFADAFIGGIMRPMLYTVMGAVVFVLLIACANVASLLLSRSVFRAREIALRMAMGATRWRVVRQLLIESIVLSVIGGAIGLWLAVAGVKVFDTAMRGAGFPYWIAFTVDYTVYGYVAAICVLTGVLFGIAPALHVSSGNHNDALKEGGRGSAGNRSLRRFSTTMVVSELALTMALLVGATLMARSFIKLYSVDLGIRIDNLMTMRVTLPEEKYPDPLARLAFFERLEPKLAAIPGVEAATVTTGVPPDDERERLLEIEAPSRPDARPVHVGTVAITPRFFDVVGVALLRGRSFHHLDGAPGAETVIINELLAERFFPGEDPIGRRLRFTERQPVPGRPPDAWRTIVGMVPTIRHGSSQDVYLNSVAYVPYRQDSAANASLLVRSVLPPAVVMEAVRREVHDVDPDQPVHAMQTLPQMLAATRWWHQSFGVMFGLFAVIALVLSSVGLYAVMAYSVTQRTQEIGVRMAVGARGRQVWWMIVRRGLVQLAIALPFGLVGALGMGVMFERMLVEMTPGDPATFVAVTVLLTVVALAACVLPAMRATRVDPVIALRAD